MNAVPDYSRIVSIAIDREADVIGRDRAVALANEVDGLEVSEDGEVQSLTRPGEDVLEEVIEAYKETSGEIAAFVIARRLENELEEYSILPENVRQHL